MDLKSRKNNNKEQIFQEIVQALDSLQFGTVTIKVHEGNVTQIEVTKKKRFDDAGPGGDI